LSKIGDVVSDGGGKFDSKDLGSIFHPKGRNLMGDTESGDFESVSKDHRVFTVEPKVFLAHFFFDSLDNADLGFLDVAVEKISQLDLSSFDETLVGEHKMFSGESESGIGARSGDLESADTMLDVRNPSEKVTFVAEVWEANPRAVALFEREGWSSTGVKYSRMWLNGKVPVAQQHGGYAEKNCFAIFDAGEG